MKIATIALLLLVLAACRSSSEESIARTVCVGMPPVEAQVSVHVVDLATGQPVIGAKILFSDSSDEDRGVETDKRGEVRVAANAVRGGVSARKGSLRGSWCRGDTNRIPEDITIAIAETNP